MGSQSLCNAQKPSVLFLIFPQRQSLGHKCSTDLLGCQGNQSRAMERGTWGECSVVFTHLAGIWDVSGRKSICLCLELHALFTKWSPGDWHHVRLRVPGAETPV